MNNREIVDYILSNKLTENDVIKEIEKDEYYKNDEAIMYIFYNWCDLYDDNGKVGIKRFCDEKPNLAGNIRFSYTYEIISKEQAYKEIEQKEIREKIERLERELRELREKGE